MIKAFILVMFVGGLVYGFTMLVKKVGWLDLISHAFILVSLFVIGMFGLEVLRHDVQH